MKKILFLALMPLLFISCSSSDDDTSSNSTSDLIGYWLGVSRTENGRNWRLERCRLSTLGKMVPI